MEDKVGSVNMNHNVEKPNKNLIGKLFGSKKKKILWLVVILFAGFIIFRNNNAKKTTTTYQTAVAERGTLIKNVSASGNVSSGNNVDILTQASGTVNKVLVKNGDTVKQGQTVAVLTLDQNSLQKQAQALSSYLSAKNSVDSATAKLNSLQSAEFVANQKFINDAAERDLETTDPTYIEEWANWLQAEADYKNQFNVINQAKVSLSSAWLSYQQASANVTAPVSGTIRNLMIATGSLLTSNSSSNATVTTQSIGSVALSNDGLQAEVNLAEIDVINVAPGQKVTLTLDAYPNKTFTGKVLLVNTNGVVSSGVTNYPATIAIDQTTDPIYPNMGVTVQIITNVKDDVVLIPTSAIQTGNESTVRVMDKNGNISTVAVTTGDSNDTQTEIVTGIKEGETVVTGQTTTGSTTGTTTGTTSPFSSFGGANRNFGGGGTGAILRNGGR